MSAPTKACAPGRTAAPVSLSTSADDASPASTETTVASLISRAKTCPFPLSTDIASSTPALQYERLAGVPPTFSVRGRVVAQGVPATVLGVTSFVGVPVVSLAALTYAYPWGVATIASSAAFGASMAPGVHIVKHGDREVSVPTRTPLYIRMGLGAAATAVIVASPSMGYSALAGVIGGYSYTGANGWSYSETKAPARTDSDDTKTD